MEKIVEIIVFFVLVASVHMEVVKYEKCSNHPDFNCNVTEVRVTPCAEAPENKPCVIKRGKSAKIEFDFEPNGSYDGLETRAYWASSTGDLPWIGMDTNGCSHTACPTNPKPESFSYDLQIGSKLPALICLKGREWTPEEEKKTAQGCDLCGKFNVAEMAKVTGDEFFVEFQSEKN